MQPLWLLLSSVLLLAAPGVRPANTLPGGPAAPERFAEMGRNEQRQWVRGLLTRLDRANRLVLKSHEAAVKRTHYIVLLKRMARGGQISADELRRFLRETEQQEKAAIERLARQFRLAVYRTFRQRRAVVTRRRAGWNRVEAAWEAAGARLDEQDRLIDWLELATNRSTPGTVGPLPAAPQFEPGAEMPQSLVFQQPAEAVREPLPPTPSRPSAGLPELGRRTAGLGSPPQPGPEAVDLAPPGALASSSAVPRKPAARGPVSRHPPPGRTPVAVIPEPATPPPIADATALPSGFSARATPDAAVAAGTDSLKRRAAEGALKVAQQPVAVAPHDDQPAFPLSRAIGPSRPEPGQGFAFAQPPRNPLAGRSLAASWPKWDHVVPASPQAVQKPPGEPSAAPPVRVDLDQLTARIAGTNLALRALEAELAQDRQWNARELGPLVDQLRTLVTRNGDLALFRELLSEGQRTQVGRLESPQAAITELAALIFQARTRANGPDFPGTDARRRAELQHLDELSRELARLASGN